MDLRSWWAAAFAVAALVVGGLGVATPTAVAGSAGGTRSLAATAAPTATTVERVSPLDAAGHLRARYTVTSTRRGYCWTSSFVNGRLYRCFMGNFVMDPCWKEAHRGSVVCLLEPWSTTVTRLRLTRRLPASEGHVPGIWGLRLGGGVGVNCLVSTGAGGTVGRHHMSYFCSRGWVLLDDGPDRSRPLWTMLTAKRVGGHYELRGRKPLPVAWKAVVR